MEVQDNPDTEAVMNDYPYRAVPGKAYPVRLIHFLDGTLMVGFVTGVADQVIMVLRPYLIEADVNDANEKEIISYEMSPYLDQLAEYDPSTLDPVSIMLSGAISVSVPAEHVIRNYMQIVKMTEFLDRKPDGYIYIKDRQFPSMRTVH